jgi:nitronate monooxygenase
MWPNRTLTDLLGLELPIVQAPMAGANGVDMAVAVSNAGGLGSLPCAMSGSDKVEADLQQFRKLSDRPVNLNFFCHQSNGIDSDEQQRWHDRLFAYYNEFGVHPSDVGQGASRAPFDEQMCALVEDLTPEVVSFHFGLPAPPLIERVKRAGCKVISSATTVAEARWLEEHGCDAVIAQGVEAGGHRGMFLVDDLNTQLGTFALVPQVVDAVNVPVLAAGGIADARGIAAAFALGAAGVQIGTAYLFTPQATISDLHHQALLAAASSTTALTNVFSGRPARGLMNRVMREVGPMSEAAPGFPHAGAALAPLKKVAESRGDASFSSLWSGQAASLCQPDSAGDLTRKLAKATLAHLASLNDLEPKL